jgi:hypothetical protein
MDGNGLELEPMPIHMPETGTGSKGEKLRGTYRSNAHVQAFLTILLFF